MDVIHNSVMHCQTVGYEFKQNTDEPTSKYIINENEDKSVRNDSFCQSNQYVGKDCVGRNLDLTYLLNKPNGYLQGKLSDTDDADYYKFNIAMYRTLRMASEKYNLAFTITLDNIPEGCDYDLILYDCDGNQVGIGQDNGYSGKSVTVPNWNMENREYTVKVLAKDGSPVNADKYYHLSFQTQQAAEDNVLKQQIEEAQEYAGALRQKLHDRQDATEEKQALRQIREKYKAYYTEQMEELHNKQAAEYLAEGEVFDKRRKEELLSKMSAGEELTEQESALLNIFATAQEIDSAKGKAELNTILKEEIFPQMEKEGIDLSQYFLSVQIGAGGQVTVEGIDEEVVKTKVENIFSRFADRLIDIYYVTDTSMQNLPERDKALLKSAVDINKFIYKATNGNVSLDDIVLENGRIKGIPENLATILNQPGENLTYLGYREDILSILNYERTQHTKIMSGFNVMFSMVNGTIQTKGNVSI